MAHTVLTSLASFSLLLPSVAACVLLVSLALPGAAHASQQSVSTPLATPMEIFTRSISKLYMASAKCQDTLAQGPSEYLALISEYLSALYPNGVGYWVVPPKVKPTTDRKTCTKMMQRQLMEYKSARNDYADAYPDRPMEPPVLVAYQWDRMVPPEARQPVGSYLPRPPAADNNQGFKSQ
jgi:hypothetical protein